ncbi:MAG TPA: SDR family oxidoreductase [Patescibacteria group bacterium]|nr:SDR family oxidoreductase [Patescibacteria group bacterium]
MEKNTINALDLFKLRDRTCVITGGAGLLGRKQAEAILDAQGIPILLDINQKSISKAISFLKRKYKKNVLGFRVDITSKKDLEEIKKEILKSHGKIDVLINNAANNPKMENLSKKNWTRFENFPDEVWESDLGVGLKGAFYASQVFGTVMAKQKNGVILNISSDLGIIAPDQRIYRKPGLRENQQPVKPVTYSVIKYALIGLTKYLATYWAEKGVRVNALCPGGVINGQDATFVKNLTDLIPMGRMAKVDEYKATVLYMISDASSYMTGSVVVVDGGRTSW